MLRFLKPVRSSSSPLLTKVVFPFHPSLSGCQTKHSTDYCASASNRYSIIVPTISGCTPIPLRKATETAYPNAASAIANTFFIIKTNQIRCKKNSNNSQNGHKFCLTPDLIYSQPPVSYPETVFPAPDQPRQTDRKELPRRAEGLDFSPHQTSRGPPAADLRSPL